MLYDYSKEGGIVRQLGTTTVWFPMVAHEIQAKAFCRRDGV